MAGLVKIKVSRDIERFPSLTFSEMSFRRHGLMNGKGCSKTGLRQELNAHGRHDSTHYFERGRGGDNSHFTI